MRPVLWFPCLALLASVAAFLACSTAPVQAGRGGGDEALVELGRRLFFDPAASRGGKFACASCHRPENGFSDPRRFSVDENGKTRRHSQTLIDLKDGSGFHWDGEFDHLDQLLTARLAPVPVVMRQTRELLATHFSAAEQRGDRPSRQEFARRLQELTPPYYGPDVPVSGTPRPLPQPIVLRLQDDGRYDDAFRAAFGSARPTTERLVESMKAYLLSIRSGANRYDDYVAGRPDALTAQERRGLRLFEGEAGCAQCHVPRPDGDGFAKFTDYTFRNTGVAFNNIVLRFGLRPSIDEGLGNQTFASADIASFKVPSLRDVARRAPYMHDGSLATLEDVVAYYEKGGTGNGGLDAKLRPFELEKGEKADLVAFLHALTSKRRPGLAEPARGRGERIRVRLVGKDGKPMGHLAVKVSPYGDRLAGASRSAEPFAATTDCAGNLDFDMPGWTHVVLTAPGYEIGYDRPLPDTLRKRIRLLVVPRRRVYVEVIAHPKGKPLASSILGYANGSAESPIRLERVRATGSRRALYVTDRIRGVERVLATFDLEAPGRSSLREIDVRGGMAEPLDFRDG